MACHTQGKAVRRIFLFKRGLGNTRIIETISNYMATREAINSRGEVVGVIHYDEEEPPARFKPLGRFVVSSGLIRSNWQRVAAILQGLLVVRAEYMYDREVIEYTAYCNDFEPVSLNSIPPFYRTTITEDDAGNLTVSWERE